MTEEKNEGNQAPRFLIKGQYVKDLSFENPFSPHTLVRQEDKPSIEVGVALKAQKLDEDHFELTLNITSKAKGQESTLFMVELSYAAIIQLVNIPAEKYEQVLFIDCATIIFPFARRILADITRDGGFQPMMLEPIDFLALYEYNRNAAAEQVKAG